MLPHTDLQHIFVIVGGLRLRFCSLAAWLPRKYMNLIFFWLLTLRFRSSHIHGRSQHLKPVPDSHVNKLVIQWDTAWRLCNTVCLLCIQENNVKQKAKGLAALPQTSLVFRVTISKYNHWLLLDPHQVYTIQDAVEFSGDRQLSFNHITLLYVCSPSQAIWREDSCTDT